MTFHWLFLSTMRGLPWTCVPMGTVGHTLSTKHYNVDLFEIIDGEKFTLNFSLMF